MLTTENKGMLVIYDGCHGNLSKNIGDKNYKKLVDKYNIEKYD